MAAASSEAGTTFDVRRTPAAALVDGADAAYPRVTGTMRGHALQTPVVRT